MVFTQVLRDELHSVQVVGANANWRYAGIQAVATILYKCPTGTHIPVTRMVRTLPTI
jgi:hypothetical protein